MPKRVMVQCRTAINADAVRRESIDGVEHIIVSSATLPDDIVMNGILYPASEIASSFNSLDMTLAPVEHPSIDGQFISANDPRAIHAFHAGAFNTNIRQEDGRVHIDKFINVAEAMKTDRGKRLLDRVNELETSEKPRAIHTSVGVFLTVEELDEPRTNDDDQEYDGIARNMDFNHDAILLDSVGAAQPHQGVGIGVNSAGEEIEIHKFDLSVNKDQSVSDLRQAVTDALERSAFSVSFIEEDGLFPDHVIFWSGDNLFDVPFVVDEQGIATVVGIPLPVERSVTYPPKTNHQEEGDNMKEMIINALKTAGVETEGLSDAELFEAHSKLNVNQSETTDISEMMANAVANAIKPLSEQIEAMKASKVADGVAEVESLSEIVANSGKYPSLDAESAKFLPLEKLKEMAGNCSPSYGLSPVINSGQDERFAVPTDMPA